MKRFYFLLLSFFTVVIAGNGQVIDTLLSEKDYSGQTLLKGLHLDIGTAYLPEPSGFYRPDLFNVKTGRPSTFNIYFVKKIKLFRKYLSFNPGIGLGLDNFFFEKDLLVSPFGDSLFIEDNITGREVLKSKVSANYIDIPLELQFASSPNYKKAFKIAVGGKFGVLFSSKSKIVYEIEDDTRVKEKYSDISVNRFRYGLTGRIGYGVFNFFAYYSLSELFKDKYAPEVNPIIFGISITSF